MKASTLFHIINLHLVILVALPDATGLFSFFQCDYSRLVSVDIAILGGGASGTYAAIQLHRQNNTIALVESQERLGGQIDTYIDPETGRTVEYGVNQYTNIAEATEFLNYLGVPFVPGNVGGQPETYFDFKTGKIIPRPNRDAEVQALRAYQEQLARYPYLEDGFYLPDPVPEDLSLPFGEFFRKYGIEHAVADLSLGMGDILRLPSIYVMKHYGLHLYRNGFLFTTHRNNQEIYDKAKELLGSSVLLSSRSRAIHRDDNRGVHLCLETPTGTQLLHAKRLVVAIPLLLDTIQSTGLDLHSDETALFSNFNPVGYYVSLVRMLGLQQDIHILKNIDANDTIYGLAKLPGIWNVLRTRVPDVYIVEYGSDSMLPVDAVQQHILTDLTRLQSAGLVSSEEEPQIIRFSDHSPFYPYVEEDVIRDGFYQRLYGLQGKRNTFWTGSAFHVPDSSLLWRFTKNILVNITAGLG